jgi:hypothetical protein
MKMIPPKLNVFCAISHQQIYRPFFFNEATVTGGTYLDMLEQWLFPQLEETVLTSSFNRMALPALP